MEEIPVELIFARMKELKDQKDEITQEEKTLNGELAKRYASDIAKGLKEKDEPYGAVTVDCHDDYKLTFTTPKKVTWDQTKLAALYAEIRTGGENPLDYMKIEYDVPESKFKAWPEAIKLAFVGARTIQPGTIAIKIERKAS